MSAVVDAFRAAAAAHQRCFWLDGGGAREWSGRRSSTKRATVTEPTKPTVAASTTSTTLSVWRRTAMSRMSPEESTTSSTSVAIARSSRDGPRTIR